jgi:hypothetical protein
MAMTVQRQCESAVTEMYQDALVGSSMANGVTIITFDLRQHDLQQALGTQARLCGRQASSHVDVHALSTFHHPMTYRCILAQGFSLDAQHQRRSCTPELQGVSPSPPMSHRVLRLACYLAVVCGVSLRHMALLFAALCLLPSTKASIKRWIDAIGAPLPTPEEMRQQWRALTPATECHLDGDYPRGTANGVMVVKDAQDRLLSTPEAAAEHGDDARQCLQRCTARGLKVSAAFSDDSHSCTEAITAVSPQARLPADHFQTVKNIWGHLNKALRSYRRTIQAHGEAHQDAQVRARAKTLWQLRWGLLKKPANRSREAKQAMATLARD